MRQLIIKRLPRAGLLAAGTFLVLAVALLSPTQAEAGGWCSYYPQQIPGTQIIISQGDDCQNPPSYQPAKFTQNTGFSSEVAVLALSSQNGVIYTNSSGLTDCWWGSTPTLGSVINGWMLPANPIVTGLNPCQGGPPVAVPVTVPVYPPYPACYPYYCDPQPSCGSWNNWCQPAPQPPVYPTPPGSVLTTAVVWSWCSGCNGNFRTLWEGNYTIIVYSGNLANFNVPAGVNYDYWNGWQTISGSGPTSFWTTTVTFRLPK